MNHPTTPDTINVEVIGAAFESICDEMGETLVKASYSPNIKERRDCTTCLFDGEGRALAQAEHIPLHLGSLMGVLEAILSRYPVEDILPGDSFIGNDPFTGGGTHLPDIVLVTPIFLDGRIIAWATNLAHHADYADRGHKHIFQEGLRIPATRIMRNWDYVTDVLDLILINMQVPKERIADLNAQVAANRFGVTRYLEVVGKYGADQVRLAGGALLDYTERKVRAAIREVPNGTYSFSDVFDSNELDTELPVSVEVRVADDELFFDFEAPPQVEAGLNLVKTALLATVFYAVKSILCPEVPGNSGLFRAIHVEAPEGSILNCTAPAAVDDRTQMCQRIADIVFGVFAEAVPERVTAASNGAVTSVQFSGIDPRTNEYYVYLETIGGGNGASCCWDGLDGVQAHITNTSNLPVESLEQEYPLVVERYELVDGSGGRGKFRGGMGLHRSIRAEHDNCQCEVGVTRQTSRPWGLFGGEPGSATELTLNGEELELEGFTVTLQSGDSIGVKTPGGGGYGPPEERSDEQLEQDIREGRY